MATYILLLVYGTYCLLFFLLKKNGVSSREQQEILLFVLFDKFINFSPLQVFLFYHDHIAIRL
jgi:uncharacterized membrane protein (Fun14 family)